MDLQRQAGFACSRNMPAKTFGLPMCTGVLVEIVEARLADRNTFWMRGKPDNLLRGDIQLLVRIVRMCADRTVNIIMGFRDGPDAIKVTDTRGDRHHGRHTGSLGA